MTPRTVDDAVSVRDVSLGINDWYNVTPSIRRAIEGFAVILKDHTAHLERLDRSMAGGAKNSMPTTPVGNRDGHRERNLHLSPVRKGKMRIAKLQSSPAEGGGGELAASVRW